MIISVPEKQLAIDVGDKEESNLHQKRNVGQFLRKYFLEGQKLDHQRLQINSASEASSSSVKWTERYRNLFAFLIPFALCQLVWWSLAIRYNLFERFTYRYQMPITMILGAFVSGATSEGGGAVAFPVMTLLLKLDPTVARDFSLMIQSTGMSSSGFAILWMKIKVEWYSIVLCSLGAFISVILGLQFGDDLLTGQEKKMMFVSIWFSFAISLFILNMHKRLTYDQIPQFCAWKGVVLFLTGIVGGWLTALTGSGVDICSFCVLTLLFRVSEKVATPTSVVLMWINTWIGFYWRELIMNDIAQLTWEYFSISAPVASLMSSLGALVASVMHRQVLAGLIYVLETLSVIGFLLTRPDLSLILVGLLIIILGTIFFMSISRLGKYLSDNIEKSGDLKPIFTLGGSTCTASTASPASSNESSVSPIVN